MIGRRKDETTFHAAAGGGVHAHFRHLALKTLLHLLRLLHHFLNVHKTVSPQL